MLFVGFSISSCFTLLLLPPGCSSRRVLTTIPSVDGRDIKHKEHGLALEQTENDSASDIQAKHSHNSVSFSSATVVAGNDDEPHMMPINHSGWNSATIEVERKVLDNIGMQGNADFVSTAEPLQVRGRHAGSDKITFSNPRIWKVCSVLLLCFCIMTTYCLYIPPVDEDDPAEYAVVQVPSDPVIAGRVTRGDPEGRYQVGDFCRGVSAAGKQARGDPRGKYKFGDFSRGAVAAGKQARGDPHGGYKFGDFSRGVKEKVKGLVKSGSDADTD